MTLRILLSRQLKPGKNLLFKCLDNGVIFTGDLTTLPKLFSVIEGQDKQFTLSGAAQG